MIKTFNERDEFHCYCTTDYFLNDLERLEPKKYIPSNQDIVMCRLKTFGFPVNDYFFNNYFFQFFDFGGELYYRNKGIYLNDYYEYDTVIYFISLVGYDRNVFENNYTKNMLEESIDVFKEFINNKKFKNVKIFLLFNFVDLFEKNNK
jgi:hypothetical protein